jgi:hypothetical protein
MCIGIFICEWLRKSFVFDKKKIKFMDAAKNLPFQVVDKDF